MRHEHREHITAAGRAAPLSRRQPVYRNAYIHGGGTLTIEAVTELDGRRGLRLVLADDGPGIPDVATALTDGYSTGAGLGHGLGGTRRLVNEFVIDT